MHPEHAQNGSELPPAQAEQPLTRGRRRLAWTISIFAFLFSYVLTAGPAVFLMDRFKLSMVSRFLELLYAPLVFVVQAKVPVLGPLIHAYVELFR